MRMITQQDICMAFSPAFWEGFDRLLLAVGEGLSLEDFIVHPRVYEDEAIMVALNNNGGTGVSYMVRRALVAFGIDRAVLKLEGSPLLEVRDFYDTWVKSSPSIKGEWDQPSKFFDNVVLRVSNISCLAGDWQSFAILQLIRKAHQMNLSPETVHGILVSLRFAYTGNPYGWITERNQQYKDLVRLINETNEGETA